MAPATTKFALASHHSSLTPNNFSFIHSHIAKVVVKAFTVLKKNIFLYHEFFTESCNFQKAGVKTES
jgi:hypothetical protein